MGITFSSLFDKLFNSKVERKLLVLGLDNAGKTTFLYNLQLGEVRESPPTIGFNCENVEYRNIRFTAWDVGGQKKLRGLWQHYYHDTHGLIFVVDSADLEGDRLASAKEELHTMLQSDGLRDAKVLILANKQDSKHALPPSKVASELGMGDIRSHEWFVQGACCKTGEGIHEGMDWLVNSINGKK